MIAAIGILLLISLVLLIVALVFEIVLNILKMRVKK